MSFQIEKELSYLRRWKLSRNCYLISKAFKKTTSIYQTKKTVDMYTQCYHTVHGQSLIIRNWLFVLSLLYLEASMAHVDIGIVKYHNWFKVWWPGNVLHGSVDICTTTTGCYIWKKTVDYNYWGLTSSCHLYKFVLHVEPS